ncbi:hypothetical protein TREMEDRAFT_63235 [Tremella mesenterica DSM 1558]|uniref:uncharacterized protein n=1 Tax=Tremella mesenterica (strain ATCC 24925 / CBS 8224 / DSM 1558 / NBRC 9311 / NRRL Y-6157 / RJB 2259-6 / UBC 559-6) TaxID=578456 RepID=UPI0003F4A16C|nr:uncharacterized protein TREMEDRAFT_63235 [Tremella mesenterica DSM 1558]EIW68776.1 hypothetical protein TREMEDRAFT_63235 [Tremella mesenterica DSM 1558]
MSLVVSSLRRVVTAVPPRFKESENVGDSTRGLDRLMVNCGAPLVLGTSPSDENSLLDNNLTPSLPLPLYLLISQRHPCLNAQYLMFGSILTIALAATSVLGATQTIQVGANGALTFTPPSINASVGDTVDFQFVSGDHTVTQSTFAAPCSPMANGFNSGFMPGSSANPPTFSILVNSTSPIWIYCAQVGHCQQGMVAAINAPSKGNTFTAFQQAAEGKSTSTNSTGTGGTPSGSASASASASASSSASATGSGSASGPYGSSSSGASQIAVPALALVLLSAFAALL